MKSKCKKVKRFNKIIDKAILQILIEFDHTCTVRSHIVCVWICVRACAIINVGCKCKNNQDCSLNISKVFSFLLVIRVDKQLFCFNKCFVVIIFIV